MWVNSQSIETDRITEPEIIVLKENGTIFRFSDFVRCANTRLIASDSKIIRGLLGTGFPCVLFELDQRLCA